MPKPNQTAQGAAPVWGTFWAIALFLLSLLLFDLMGLVIKRLSPNYGAAELSAYRNIFGLIPAMIALWATADWHRQGRPVVIRQWRLGLLRGAIVVFAQFMFYLSLARIAFATATTISYSNALLMTAFAVPLLGERVGAMRWLAVLIGFAGVILVVRPEGDAMSLDALLPVGAAALYALVAVTARLVDRDVPSPLLNLYSAGTGAVGSTIFALIFFGFSPVQSISDMGWIISMGGFGGSAVLCLVVASRMTEQSNLAPFSYFGIPLAFVLGWLFFGEAPWRDLFPGAILIVAAGLLILWRERRLSRRA